MRTEILEFIQQLDLKDFALSVELPRDDSDTPMFVKNPKRIYVDLEQLNIEPIIQTLDGVIIENQTTSVTVTFSCDAKRLPSSYSDTVQSLMAIRKIPFEGRTARTQTVDREYLDDLLITAMTFTFTKLP